MAAIDWPDGLPLRPGQDGFQGTLGAGIVVSKLESGPTFRRQRSNAKPDKFTASMVLIADQLDIFDHFFRVETRGCLRFNWLDELGVAAECRFVGAPDYSNASGLIYRVKFEFEVLP